jgi:hypothetical protein
MSPTRRAAAPLDLAAAVRSALATSERISQFLLESLPDAVAFVAYLIAHEAHHRGQICTLARQLGHRLPNAVTFGMWEWNKRRQEAISASPSAA